MPESNTPTNKQLKPGRVFAVANQTDFEVAEELIAEVINGICDKFDWAICDISIAIVDDSSIHELNRNYLQHDFPTDVLTFPDDRSSSECLLGEIVVSADTARYQAAEINVDETGEILLYIIHGMLHLAGFDDQTDDEAKKMREEEKYFLERLGYRYQYNIEENADES